MKKYFKIALFCLLALVIVEWVFLLVDAEDFIVLNPKGWVAGRERSLIIVSLLLMCIVVVPVIVMTVLFAWKFRAGNKRAKYSPDWDHSNLAEVIWWGVPFLIIIVLSVITWTSSHELDPFKPLMSDKKPLTIQVVALR